MISTIRGIVTYIQTDTLVIETASGVGYDVYVGEKVARGFTPGQEVSVYTYLKVTETDMQLFGFQTREEKSFFELLLSVKGVGPKTAMHILSLGAMYDIQSAVSRGDIIYLTAVQGLGKKTAERIVVELKGKLAGGSAVEVMSGGVLSEVVDALVGFGYSKEEAKEMVAGIEVDSRSTEDVLKYVLQQKRNN